MKVNKLKEMNNNLAQLLNLTSTKRFEQQESLTAENFKMNLSALSNCLISDDLDCELDVIMSEDDHVEQSLPEHVFLTIIVFYCLIFVVGLVGNTLVIYVVSR